MAGLKQFDRLIRLNTGSRRRDSDERASLQRNLQHTRFWRNQKHRRSVRRESVEILNPEVFRKPFR